MLTRFGGMRNITMINFFSKLVYPKQRYCDFSIFQMAAVASFYFKITNFWLAVSRVSGLISMSKFGKIGQ